MEVKSVFPKDYKEIKKIVENMTEEQKKVIYLFFEREIKDNEIIDMIMKINTGRINCPNDKKQRE